MVRLTNALFPFLMPLCYLVDHIVVDSQPCNEYPSWNGCKNPMNSICNSTRNKCLCSDETLLHYHGYCLTVLTSIDEPCWISEQCLVSDSKCFDKNGKGGLLETINKELWHKYVRSNASELLIPGICQCNIGYMFDAMEGTCISRLIDTPCMSNSDCLRRSPSSRCSFNKCICSARHLYNSHNDKCIYVGEGTWQRRNCLERPCRNGPGERYIYNHSLANIFGFSLSMTMLMVVWIVVRNCHRTRLSERSRRLDELRYSDLRIAYDAFEVVQNSVIDGNSIRQNRGREQLPSYQDTQPPSYEEAVIKIDEPASQNANRVTDK